MYNYYYNVDHYSIESLKEVGLWIQDARLSLLLNTLLGVLASYYDYQLQAHCTMIVAMLLGTLW